MIRISHKHKAIFCHIPRTGGTSIEHVLKDWQRKDHTYLAKIKWEYWPHEFIGMGQYVFNYLPRDYYIFTTVRNPYDRYASGLQHHMRQRRPVGPYWYQEHVMATQKATLGDLAPDYMMRLENIEGDFEFIKNKFALGKLPHLNSTKPSKLTRPMIDWVNEHFAEDFDMLGYEKR